MGQKAMKPYPEVERQAAQLLQTRITNTILAFLFAALFAYIVVHMAPPILSWAAEPSSGSACTAKADC